jgi:protein ImuA
MARAEQLIGTVRRLIARSGGLSLDFLAERPAEEAADWLVALGLAPSLAAEVLAAAPIRHRIVYPSQAASRVLTRLGVAGSAAEQGGRLSADAPAGWSGAELAELGALLHALGESLCRPLAPECAACPLVQMCPQAAQAVQPCSKPALLFDVLRRRVARIEARETQASPSRGLRLGVGTFDEAVFPNGLPPGAHQAAPVSMRETAAPIMLALAAARAVSRWERPRDGGQMVRKGGRLRRVGASRFSVSLLVVQETDALRESGELHPDGLRALGLDGRCVAFVRVSSDAEALRVIDEALKLKAAPVVLAELRRGEGLIDLAASRRLNLAARRAGVWLFLVTPDLSNTSAALTRWRVGCAPSGRAGRRRLGAPAFTLELVRNRLGPPGAWTVEWDVHEQRFRPRKPAAQPLSAPVVSSPLHRPAAGVAAGRAAA